MQSGVPLLRTAATSFATIFLVAQVLFGLAQQFDANRLFLFTPYSGQTAFRLNVTVNSRSQTTAQIRHRYQLPFKGLTDLTPEGLQKIVRYHETVYAPRSETFVRMHFSRNRGPEEIWLWPQQ